MVAAVPQHAGNVLDHQALLHTGAMSVLATGGEALRVVLFQEEKMCYFFRGRSCYLLSPRTAHVHLL